jgi:hypothetical protein
MISRYLLQFELNALLIKQALRRASSICTKLGAARTSIPSHKQGAAHPPPSLSVCTVATPIHFSQGKIAGNCKEMREAIMSQRL